MGRKKKGSPTRRFLRKRLDYYARTLNLSTLEIIVTMAKSRLKEQEDERAKSRAARRARQAEDEEYD